MKRVAVILLSLLILATTQGIHIYAEPGEEGELTAEEILQAEKDAIYQLEIQSNKLNNWPVGPQTYAQSSIVMDMDSGAILYAKNVDEKLYPASITKLVTALVALENAELTDRVYVTEEAVSFLEWNYAQIGLRAGEEISMSEALHATLLKSANEAAYAVGANTGEGYEWFLEEMNRWVEKVGARNSHFTNTHGLHDEQHYTTTRDMALLGSALRDYPEAFDIMQTTYSTIPPTNVDEEEKHMSQNHKMLLPNHEKYYEYATGGKTGFTNEAGTTLVTFASKDGINLVCVTMKSWANNVYDDTTHLLEYGFQNFEKVFIQKEYLPKDVNLVEDAGYVMLPVGITLQDLESEVIRDVVDESRGELTYTYEGQEVGRMQVSVATIEEEQQGAEEIAQMEAEETQTGSKNILVWIGRIAIGIIVLFVLLLLWVERKKRKERKRKKRRARRRR